MTNLQLKKKLKINVKKMLLKELKEVNSNNIDRWKSISNFLGNRCIECNKTGNTSVHLKVEEGYKLVERAKSKKQGYFVITTIDMQIYARNCGLKYSYDKNFCSLSW